MIGENPGMSGYIIGVTGGVASGKSEVTRRFEALGVVVADADIAARAAVAAYRRESPQQSCWREPRTRAGSR